MKEIKAHNLKWALRILLINSLKPYKTFAFNLFRFINYSSPLSWSHTIFLFLMNYAYIIFKFLIRNIFVLYSYSFIPRWNIIFFFHIKRVWIIIKFIVYLIFYIELQFYLLIFTEIFLFFYLILTIFKISNSFTSGL